MKTIMSETDKIFKLMSKSINKFVNGQMKYAQMNLLIKTTDNFIKRERARNTYNQRQYTIERDKGRKLLPKTYKDKF